MRPAGEYREPVTVESYTEAKDGSGTGELVKTWTTYLSTRCKYMPGPGREYVTSDQTASSAVCRFCFRMHTKSEGITEKMRLLFKSVYWDIDSAVPDYVKREIVVIATQKR